MMLPCLSKSVVVLVLNLAKIPRVDYETLETSITYIYCEITTFPCQSIFILPRKMCCHFNSVCAKRQAGEVLSRLEQNCRTVAV